MKTQACRRKWLLLVALVSLYLAGIFPVHAARCLYVSSYHPGYEWNDGIERGMATVLDTRCELRRFYMDTKRHTASQWAEEKVAEALELIAVFKPDVIIAADDNASKYLVMPHLRDAGTPVVFCGLNWTVGEYGYPYTNATGMVEVAPILPLLKVVRRLSPMARHGLFMSAAVATDRKDYEHYRSLLAQEGVRLTSRFVHTMPEWEQAYREVQAQTYDFVIFGNNAGIADWDKSRAAQFALDNARVLTVSTNDWMIPYAAMAITKVPEEQGEWAAKAALAILDGMVPADIPIVPNRRWEVWINPALVEKLHLTLPRTLLLKAKEYR